MKLSVTKGSTGVLTEVFIRDSSSTTGAGLTGLVFNSASLTAYYYRSGAATATSISLQMMTVGTWATGGFKEIDATNMPGFYQLGIPDAALAAGTNKVEFHLKGAVNMAPLPFEIQLLNLDLYDGVRAGLSALPNAAAGTTGGLGCLVLASGTASAGAATSITLAGASATDSFYNHQLVHTTGGTGANQTRLILTYVGGSKLAIVNRAWAITPDNTTTWEVLAAEQTSTWQLLAGIMAAATATTATLPGAVATDDYYKGALLVTEAGTGLRQARTIISSVGATGVVTLDRPWATTPDATTVFVIYAADAPKVDSSLQTTAASVQGNVTGSVASVTGAVGSVTGNVGGNVVGSVASVTAAVDILQTAADKVWGTTSRTLSAFAQGFSDQVWTTAARTLTAFGFSVTVGTNNDKTGYGLSSTAVQAIWDALTSALTTAGSIGKLLVDNVNATISSRLASGSYTSPPTAATISTQVWTEPIPGSYASGTAGNILGNRLDAAVSTRLATSGYTAPLDAATTKAQVVAALATDLYAEPSAPPAATATLKDKIGWMAASSRNKITGTATATVIRNDGDTAAIGTSADSDDGTVSTRGKFS